MSVRFDPELCDKNPYCPVTRICPKDAMSIDRRTFRLTFDPDKCSGCGTCLSSCPHAAVCEE